MENKTPSHPTSSFSMSAVHRSLPSTPPLLPLTAPAPPAAANDPARLIFTRQLWRRNMPTGSPSGQVVSSKSHALDAESSPRLMPSASPRAPAAVSPQDPRRSLSPSRAGSKTPLTPEESPPFRATRKRTAGIAEEEDKEIDSADASPAQTTRTGSGDSAIHVCICQPDPKIPRPRNAFILYRQHHQASVVAQHPGLANPEISKIIGEQWQNQPAEVKSKWKALADEEKLRHQQQYPTYRYQPKRNGRRNSVSADGANPQSDKAKCSKCGGRSILAPSTPFIGAHTQASSSPVSGPSTPGSSTITPTARTLPVLRDLSLQSPAFRRMGRPQARRSMSPNRSHHDDRDDLGPLSPDNKRRRYGSDHPQPITRVLPPRYVTLPPGAPMTPGTPYPFSQPPPPPPHSYPVGTAVAQIRRESLPGLRGMVSSQPVSMAPPPRPTTGYQQHRLSQGHVVPHDRSLTLPPLQTSGTAPSTATTAPSTGSKSAKEQILSLDFRYRIGVLRQVAPAVSVRKGSPRGPLVAIEGDSAEAVVELGAWLRDTLGGSGDLSVKLVDGPAVSAEGSKELIMAGYHRLVAEWLVKSVEISESLLMKVGSPTDSVMKDVRVASPTQKAKAIEAADDSSDQSPVSKSDGEIKASETEKPDADTTETTSVPQTPKVTPPSSAREPVPAVKKPLMIVANYTLHASTFYACHIPLAAGDPYSPQDHWSWTATQWRGIVSPDLTLYVRDAVVGDTGKPTVEIMEERNLFVVKRTQTEGRDAQEIEPSVLRRLGFEVSEWVRAFGAGAGE